MNDARPKSAEVEILLRSPEMMNPSETLLLVVDLQERLLPAIGENQRLVWNARRLIDAAKILGVACFATEQYPEKLGSTVEPLASMLPQRQTKLSFSCTGCAELTANWEPTRHRVLLCGIETHVCVAQTAFDLLSAGYRVYVPVDAVGSRYALDHETALRRMETSGVILTTSEAAMFELCQTAGTPEFKKISALAKEIVA